MEEITIKVTGDQRGDKRVHVSDQILINPKSFEKELGITIKLKINTHKREATLNIDYGKYIIHLIQEPKRIGGNWRVNLATLNLTRILFHHSSRLILSEVEFQAALTTANNRLNQLVTAKSKDLIIPALIPGNRSYFESIVIANQIPDPNGYILNSLKNARLPYYCTNQHVSMAPNSWGNSEKVYISNKSDGIIIAAFHKDKEINKERKAHGNPKHQTRWHVTNKHRNCLRIEMRLNKRLMTNAVLNNSNAYTDGERLLTLPVKDAYATYERVMRKVKGVFRKTDSNYSGPVYCKDKVWELTAPYKNNPNLFPLHLELQKLRLTYSDSAVIKLRGELEKWLENNSTVRIDEILPNSAICKRMQIEPLKKQGHELVPVFQPGPAFFHIDKRIAKAYSDLSTLHMGNTYGPDLPWLIDGKWQR